VVRKRRPIAGWGARGAAFVIAAHAAQEHGVDMEEAGREDRRGLGVEERPPGLPAPPE
jgi:hypothetical protein